MMSIQLEKVVQTFYEGLEEGKILGRKCPLCGNVEFPPVYACNQCGNSYFRPPFHPSRSTRTWENTPTGKWSWRKDPG